MRAAIAAVVLGSAGGVLVSAAAALGIADAPTRWSWDLLWPDGHADSRVRVVAIDDATIAERGAWPWSRSQQSALVEAALAAGARVVAYDVDVPVAPRDRLSDVLARDDVVAARSFDTARSVDGRWLHVTGGSASDQGGHSVVTPDADGVVRRIPAFVETSAGDFLPSLALAAASRLTGAQDTVIVRPSSMQLGAVRSPVERDAEVRIHWADDLTASSPAVISAGALLDGTVPAGTLRGSAVVVGLTAGDDDRHSTPLDPDARTPGVLVQAQLLDTALQRAWVTPMPPLLAGMIGALLGALVAFAGLCLRMRLFAAATIAAIVLPVIAELIAFRVIGVLPEFVRLSAVVLLVATIAIGLRIVAEQRERRRAEGLFSRYVPKAVALDLLRGGRAGPTAEGERLDVAVLFCDLRGFTPMSAALDPGQVREVLDLFYDFVCARVFDEDGTVLQFVGDEVFAVFGAPRLVTAPSARATAVAARLQRDRAELHDRLHSRGLPVVEFGIGVHAGPVVAVHVGPEDRRQYAVIGDTVNVGSRLCGLAAAGEVVASDVAVAASGRWEGQDPESVKVKGKVDTLTVHRARIASV